MNFIDGINRKIRIKKFRLWPNFNETRDRDWIDSSFHFWTGTQKYSGTALAMYVLYITSKSSVRHRPLKICRIKNNGKFGAEKRVINLNAHCLCLRRTAGLDVLVDNAVLKEWIGKFQLKIQSCIIRTSKLWI